MVHRNTYINGPTVLRETWQVKGRDDLFFAGQISGVEGYVESAASGLIAGRNAAARVLGRPLSVPPRTTAIGALAYYVSHANPAHYQPTNITFGIIAPLAPEMHARRWLAGRSADGKGVRLRRGSGGQPSPDTEREGWKEARRSRAAEREASGGGAPRASKKAVRNLELAERALNDLEAWLKSTDRETVPTP
jgi:hypothetical protein